MLSKEPGPTASIERNYVTLKFWFADIPQDPLKITALGEVGTYLINKPMNNLIAVDILAVISCDPCETAVTR